MANVRQPNSNKFLWYRDLPSWFAGAGTIAIAIIAISTLGPVIENLDLRDRNLELRESNRKLQQEMNDSKSEKRQLKRSLEHLKIQIKDAKKQETQLNKRQNDLLQALIKISGNVSAQVDREGKLSERLKSLQTEAQNLEIKKTQLETENRHLLQERSKFQDKHQRAQNELTRISDELQSTYRLNRRFILEQMKTKVVHAVPVTEKYQSSIYFKYYTPVFKWFAMGRKSVPTKDLQDQLETGRKILFEEFGSQVFKLLPEDRRLMFEDAIQKFIDKHNKVFSEILFGDSDLLSRLSDARRVASTTKGSKYFNKDAVRMYGGKPESVSQHKIETRESAYEKAKLAYEKEVAKVHSTRRALHDAMDRMVAELTDFK
jgi:predicted  nucleic acid-binding Zn-ribbon protein